MTALRYLVFINCVLTVFPLVGLALLSEHLPGQRLPRYEKG